MIRIEGTTIHVETATLQARFEGAWLVSLVRRRDGRQWLPEAQALADSGVAAMQLMYADGPMPVDRGPDREITVHQWNENAAEVRLHGWHGDGVLAIRVDAETGDLLVEPSAYSSRPAARAIRWNFAGFAATDELVLPLFQGAKLPAADTLLCDTDWPWPYRWEAALAIGQGADGGWSIHAQDTADRFKALHVGHGDTAECLGLETEATGPWPDNPPARGLK